MFVDRNTGWVLSAVVTVCGLDSVFTWLPNRPSTFCFQFVELAFDTDIKESIEYRLYFLTLLSNLPISLPNLNSLIYLLACSQVPQLIFSLSRTVPFVFVFQLFHGVDWYLSTIWMILLVVSVAYLLFPNEGSPCIFTPPILVFIQLCMRNN